jgi:hypothetical protein
MAPQSRGDQKIKKQTAKCYKGWFQTLTKFLVCCFVAIKVQK